MCSVFLLIALLGDHQADEILSGNEQATGAIYTLRTTIQSRVSEDGGGSWMDMTTLSVLRTGQKEMWISRGRHLFVGGRIEEKLSYFQRLSTTEGQWDLAATNLEEPPRGPIDYVEMDMDGKRVGGTIRPPQPFGPAGYGMVEKTLMFTFAGKTLRELFSSTGNVRAKAGSDGRGEPTWEFNLRDSDSRRFEISLSPSHNYLACKLVMSTKDGQVYPYFGMLVVEKWQEPKPGIFLPKVVRSGSPSRPGFLQEIQIGDTIVNEPMVDEKFQLDFPSGAAVRDETHANCVYIWGEGKPEMTFKDLKEFDRWKDARKAAILRRRRQASWLSSNWPWVLAISTIGVGGVFWLRR